MAFSADQIAAATGTPQRNVAACWPLILTALDEFGINTDLVQAAAAATIAVETGSFMPLKERHADPVRQPTIWALQARYWDSGYMGRGFIQLTWRANYDKYGKLLGLDLVANPDLVAQPMTASRVLAAFFSANGIDKAANAKDWAKVRKLVNGGTIGLDRMLQVIKNLGGDTWA